MRKKFFTLTVSLLLIILLKLTISYCSVKYNHQKDVVYGYKDGMALVMDIYPPIDIKNGAGIIVIISGGLISNPERSHDLGDREDVQAFLRGGYVVFVVAHSSQPKYTMDEIKWDIPRAVRYIRHNSNQFGIMPNRIGIIGYSSGGSLSLLAATSPPSEKMDSLDPVERESSKVQAAVAYYPSTDLLNHGSEKTTILEHFNSLDFHVDASLDFHQWDEKTNMFERVTDEDLRSEYYRRNSPFNFITEDDPPMLLIHGDKDSLVPIQQSLIFIDKLIEFSVANRLLVMEGQGHGWKNPQEGELEEVLSWFDKYLTEK